MNSPITKVVSWVALAGVVLLFMFHSSAPTSPFVSTDGQQVGSISSPSRSTSGTIVPTGMWGGLQVGPQSQVPLIKATSFSTCNLAETVPGSFAATTTMQFGCTVPASFSLQTGDLVQVTLGNGHAAAFGSFRVVDAVASTTGFGGTISVYLSNETGTATSSFILATTSAQVEINRI